MNPLITLHRKESIFVSKQIQIYDSLPREPENNIIAYKSRGGYYFNESTYLHNYYIHVCIKIAPNQNQQMYSILCEKKAKKFTFDPPIIRNKLRILVIICK